MAGGNFSLNLRETVTLNSVQGPFPGTDRSAVRQRGRAVSSLSAATGLKARWTLKRVQGDGELGKAL